MNTRSHDRLSRCFSQSIPMIIVFFFVTGIIPMSFTAAQSYSLPPVLTGIKPLYEPFPQPQPGDWQYEQKEPGQTYAQYMGSRVTTATDKRGTIYVQVIGGMTPAEESIIDLTIEYLGIFYGLKTKKLDSLPRSIVPFSARRIHPTWGVRQINATYIIEKILIPRLPDDAAAYIAFTAEDLYPDENWNFCFGQAMYEERVGVWSIARNGQLPEEVLDSADPRQVDVLRRTLRIASHEVGHMFTIMHCISFKCNMNGVNSLEEADRTPLEFCPECLGKLEHATKINYLKRWAALKRFYDRTGLKAESAFVDKIVESI